MDSINDIEPIVENSFEYLFLTIYALLFLIAAVVVYVVIKRVNKKEKSPYDILDFNNPNKELLYLFTIIAKKEGLNSELKELLKELEPYKYSKDAKEIDSAIIGKIQEYIKRVKRGNV